MSTVSDVKSHCSLCLSEYTDMVNNVDQHLRSSLKQHLPGLSDSDSDGEFVVGKSKKSSPKRHKSGGSTGRRSKRATSSRVREAIKYTEVNSYFLYNL